MEVIDGKETGNDVFAEEVRDRAREASTERRIGRSEKSGRT